MPKTNLCKPKEDKLTILIRGYYPTGAALARALRCATSTGNEIVKLPRKKINLERLVLLSKEIDVAELASAVFGCKLILDGKRSE